MIFDPSHRHHHIGEHQRRDRQATSVSHTVEIVALDDFLNQRAVTSVALLKIDTEGHELETLRGARRAIERGLFDIIQFEFNEMSVASRYFISDIFAVLPNYTFFRLLSDGLVAIESYPLILCELSAFQNVIAIKNDRIEHAAQLGLDPPAEICGAGCR